MATDTMRRITRVVTRKNRINRTKGVRVQLDCGHETTTTNPEVGGQLTCITCDQAVQKARFGGLDGHEFRAE